MTRVDSYYDFTGLTYTTGALGLEGVSYLSTEYAYDDRGRQSRVESPDGTIRRTVYDGLNRQVSSWIGTDDTPTSGEWSPTNTDGTNLVKTMGYEYDG